MATTRDLIAEYPRWGGIPHTEKVHFARSPVWVLTFQPCISVCTSPSTTGNLFSMISTRRGGGAETGHDGTDILKLTATIRSTETVIVKLLLDWFTRIERGHDLR